MNIIKEALFITYVRLPRLMLNRVRKFLTFEKFSLVFGSIILLGGLYFINLQVGGFFKSRLVSANDGSVFFDEIKPANQVPKRIEGKPIRVQVPSTGIDLEVIDGNYDYSSDEWTLTKDKAQFGLMTALANNESGSTYIYGHNRKGVFIKLPQVKAGDVAKVITDNNKVFTYRFREAITTDPVDIKVLNYQGAPILTLQTCTGIKYQDRTLFIFDFEGIES